MQTHARVRDAHRAGEDGFHGYHVLLGAAVGFAGPVVEHDGLTERPWGVADRGALEVGEDFGAELGVERAFEHGGDRIDGGDLSDRW